MRFISKLISGAVIIGGLAACATTEPIPEPVLQYKTAANQCSADIDLNNAIAVTDNTKSLKRMMKNRTLILSDVMDAESPCILQSSGTSSPYAIFELPSGIKGPVVYAGSKIDANSMFAADIVILDKEGAFLRRFKTDEFRKLGTQFGVQFRPKDKDAYVLIKADENMIGGTEDTLETSFGNVYVSNANGYGGNNIVGRTQEFTRTYSYDGEVGLRIVFPKQDKK